MSRHANRTIIVTGACGGSITGLTNLNPDFDDPNLYYNFHMYEPHSFTHQRSDDAHDACIRMNLHRMVIVAVRAV